MAGRSEKVQAVERACRILRAFHSEGEELALTEIGNAPRDVVRGRGINNFDMAIFKTIPVWEKYRFQLRFEAYNAFNHTQFSGMNTTAQFNPATGQQVNASLGTLISARTPRVGQASLRFLF